jgi:hypothetical protein
MKFMRPFNFNSIRLFTAISLSSLAGGVVSGATYTAADCTVANVQAAVNHATNGDTVLIPAGTATWTNGLVINNVGISLIGAGAGVTVITNAWTNASSGTSLISCQYNYPHFVRISGFTICNSSAPYADVNIGGTTQTNFFRVDHMQFYNLSKAGITPNGYALGLIDHCFFSSITNGGATGISITGEGAYSWDTRPPTWGDTNKVVIEDCSFYWFPLAGNGNGAVDSYNGARWCFRHNWVTNINVGCHGTDSSGSMRSTHSYEVYNNYFENDTTSTYLILGGFRGGTGIFFSNTLVGAHVGAVVDILNYRNSGTNVYGGTNPCCLPWGPITGADPYDGNLDQYGWPAYDSPGSTSPTMYFTNCMAPNGIGTNGYTVQARQPVYSWSNTCNGGPVTIIVGNAYTNTGLYAEIPSDTMEIQANRDYFDNTVMTNYVIDGVSYPYVPLVYPHPLSGPYEPLTDYVPLQPIPAQGEAILGPSAPSFMRTVATNPPASVITNGLIAWYGTGYGTTLVDWSGNGDNGTNYNGPLWQPGAVGVSLNFPYYSSSYVDCGPMPAVNGLSAMTVTFWAKLEAVLSNIEYVLAKYDSSNTQTAFAIGKSEAPYGSNNGLWVQIPASSSDNNTYAYTGDNVFGTNWVFVAVVFNGSLSGNANCLSFYTNGVNDPSITFSGTIPPALQSTTSDVTIGSYSDHPANIARYWEGSVDELRIYSRALAPTEISSLWQYYTGVLGAP